MEKLLQVPLLYLVLASLGLLVAGILAGRRMSWRWRWLWLVPALVVAAVAWRVESGIRADARRSRALFFSVGQGMDLGDAEAEAFRALARSSLRVREGVLHLAFASATNAALALPRAEILLQSALLLDAGGERQRLWDHIVQPALQAAPSAEVILLSAATTILGGYGSNQAVRVLRELQTVLATESNTEARSIAAGLFVPLSEHASPEQLERVAGLLLSELLLEDNPMQVNTVAGTVKRAGSRRVGDLRRVASHLKGAAAQRFADQLIPALENQTNQSRALAVGKVLLAVKAQLDGDRMTRAMTNLVALLPRGRGGVLPERADPLVGLAEVMTPEQAAQAANLLLPILLAEGDPWWRAELSRPLPPLAQRLTDEALQKLAEAMVAAFAGGLLESICDRIPAEQAYRCMDRLTQWMLDTPNPTFRHSQVPRLAPLGARLTPERAGKLTEELWSIFLKDADDQRWMDEAGCLAVLAPRLTDEQAASLGQRVAERMRGDDDGRFPALMTILTPLLPRCPPQTRQSATDSLMARYQKPASSQAGPVLGPTGLEQPAFLLAAHLTPEQMHEVLEPLVAAIEARKNPAVCMGVCGCLAPLADHLDDSQARRVGTRLVFLYTQKPDTLGMGSMNRLATNLTLSPNQAKFIHDLLLPQALACRMPTSSYYADWAGTFGRRLGPEDAEAAAGTILAAMAQAREPMWAVLDGKCLLPVLEPLRPDQLLRQADRLLQLPAHRPSPGGLWALTDPAHSQAASAEWRMPSQFIARQESGRYLYRLQAWSRSLAGVLARLNRDDSRRVAEALAARCEEQGWIGLIGFEEQTAIALHYAPEPALRRILQTPFAVGGLRQMVLRAWELQTGESVEGDLWRFVSRTSAAKPPAR